MSSIQRLARQSAELTQRPAHRSPSAPVFIATAAAGAIAGIVLLSRARTDSRLKSYRSVGALLSAVSVLSIASAGSVLSIGSFASLLSIGSSASVLSIGSDGGFLSIGRSSLK